MYNLNKDSRITKEQKYKIKKHISKTKTIEESCLFQMGFSLFTVFSLTLIMFCMFISKNHEALFTTMIPVIFGFIFLLSYNCVFKNRAKYLADIVNVCNIYEKDSLNFSAYKDFENNLFVTLCSIKNNYSDERFADVKFFEKCLSGPIKNYVYLFKQEDKNNILKSQDYEEDFIKCRAEIIANLLCKKVIKKKVIKRSEKEFTNPQITAERLFCYEIEENADIFITNNFYHTISSMTLEDKTKLIGDFSKLKKKWNLDKFTIDIKHIK